MNNIFKQNSRFASLMEDNISQKKNNKDADFNRLKNENNIKNENKEIKFNSFKNNREKDNIYKPYDDKERQRLKEQERKQKKELESKETLAIENFPSLSIINTKKIVENKISYIDNIKESLTKLQNSNKSENIDPDLVNLKPGHILLKLDPKSNQIIKKEHTKKSIIEEDLKLIELQNCRNILYRLVDLHEKRTEKYIDTYGYDTWEKMFKIPNWQQKQLEYMSDSDEEYEDIQYDIQYDNEDLYS